jgi:hypothetical protein
MERSQRDETKTFDDSTDADRVERSDRRATGTFDDYLPQATVDSRWWYWIAAVPIYFVVTALFGIFWAIAFVLGFGLDLAGLGGLATLGTFSALFVAVFVLALVGIALAVAFPLAIYVDAAAIERANLDWKPDPVLYGIVALAAVVVTNFVLSVPLSLFYLYKRHEAVGTP